MSQKKSQLAQVIGTALTVVILLAVPAFAISFADVSIFAQSASLDPSPATTSGDDATILNNWQFTGDTRHSSHPVTRPTKPTKPTKQTDHKSQHTGR